MNTEVHNTQMLAELQRTIAETDKLFHEARLHEKRWKWYVPVFLFGGGGLFFTLLIKWAS